MTISKGLLDRSKRLRVMSSNVLLSTLSYYNSGYMIYHTVTFAVGSVRETLTLYLNLSSDFTDAALIGKISM